MPRSVASNIWKLNVIQGLRWFMLIMPIIVVFYQANGLSMREVLLLQSAYSIAIILLEIPSGYFSDVLGRKPTITIGCVLCFLGLLTYALTSGFWGFLIAELTIGLGASFMSGTDSALLYDSLVEMGKEQQFKKIEGRRVAVTNFSEGIAGIVGGMLAVINLRAPFFTEAGVIFLSIPIALSLVEPTRHKYQSKEGTWRGIMKIVKYSLHDHKEVKWLIFYSGVANAATLTAVWFVQPYLQFVGLPLLYFGWMWAALNISVGLFSLWAHKYEEGLGRKASLVSLIFLAFIAYLLVGFSQSFFAIAYLFIFYFVRGISVPVLTDYVNQIITSDLRATVLSVKNLVSRALFAVLGPFLGWISDVYSLQTALLTSGAIFFCLGVISLIFLHRHKAL
jgi:MFS family permease